MLLIDGTSTACLQRRQISSNIICDSRPFSRFWRILWSDWPTVNYYLINPMEFYFKFFSLIFKLSKNPARFSDFQRLPIFGIFLIHQQVNQNVFFNCSNFQKLWILRLWFFWGFAIVGGCRNVDAAVALFGSISTSAIHRFEGTSVIDHTAVANV